MYTCFLFPGCSSSTKSVGDPGDCSGPGPSHRSPVSPPAGRTPCSVGEVLHRRGFLQTGPGYLRGQIWLRSLSSGQGTGCPCCVVPETGQVSSLYKNL